MQSSNWNTGNAASSRRRASAFTLHHPYQHQRRQASLFEGLLGMIKLINHLHGHPVDAISYHVSQSCTRRPRMSRTGGSLAGVLLIYQQINWWKLIYHPRTSSMVSTVLQTWNTEQCFLHLSGKSIHSSIFSLFNIKLELTVNSNLLTSCGILVNIHNVQPHGWKQGESCWDD